MTTMATRMERLLPKHFATMCVLDVVRAQGAYVYDAAGNVYLDFASSSSATNLGHCHPKVQTAIREQMDCFVHTFFQQIPYQIYLDLVEKLHSITPGNFAKKTVLNTTGSEAVETAIRIARAATGRDLVVSFGDAFHGRSFLCSGLSNSTGGNYKVPDVACIPFVAAGEVFNEAEYLKKYVTHKLSLQHCAAFIIEPVQGESGFNVADKAFMTWLRETATNNGIVLIADEIQCGLARTGRMFASQHYAIEPDIMLLSKTLGGGLPLSAVVGRAEIMDAQTAFGGTFSGSPLAIAAAIKVLEVLEEENLCKQSRTLGGVCAWHLAQMVNRFSFVKKLHGIGAMLALEIDIAKHPGLTTQIQQRARDYGVLLPSAGKNKSRLRFLYPLTITIDELKTGLQIVESVLEEIENELQP
jgi:4-aminobutyrate aminotransferase/(S)-3-amino-2-methylpropionate transaminase